ncbi:conserved hypothetical protein [Perkinsus marinus ATCC 50983]|uniref:Amino acid transporter n=1 Tax=Perkinsus marinus (strain ATCC 50983 / TXsc) TaxID=423536 RepID=C5L879_PERM5|nr:conserved hypothetical protein [Perkinsus marinus ATCC 50983]EER07035.1 conserved hypothetical protein [Perkinsus marinus ATCC 50983]|eukprot:XP_002775219.1 conserved hypothetical protein [Perkinsus marinus ATCC 50983]
MPTSVKVCNDSDTSPVADTTSSTGAVCKEMEEGISLRAFIAACGNSVITQALSIPFMFTTAGWVSFVTQALAVCLAFVCIQMLRTSLNNEKVKEYAELKGVPKFEREYTFLGEFCAGKFGRGATTLLIFLQYFLILITNLGAMGVCAALFIPGRSSVTCIIIVSAISLLMILLPWLKEITSILGILAIIGIIGSMATWVGSAFAILPDSHVVDNLPVREPAFINLVTAFSLSMWTSADLPSLVSYLGSVKGASDRSVTWTILICLILSIVYVYIMGVAGMQICDGVCDDFYPASLHSASVVPSYLKYGLYTFILLRMFSIMLVIMVPLMVACETAVGRLLTSIELTSGIGRFRAWRFVVRTLLMVAAALGAILVENELAYSQAVASTLLTLCSLYLWPLWFYACIVRPAGLKLWGVYLSLVLLIAFIVIGTYTSIMGFISRSTASGSS